MDTQTWSAYPNEAPLISPVLDRQQDFAQLVAAAKVVKESQRLLEKAGLNVVSELLRGQGTFYQLDHYPKDDVYDNDTQSQYYYHNHRGIENEHGHFHTFLRTKFLHDVVQPMEGFMRTEPWPLGEDALSHFICISMDADGKPIGLFATNRWVTGQTWYSAKDTISLLERFLVDHAYPNLAVNQWLSAMFVLFRSHIIALLEHRDEVIKIAQIKDANSDVLEDRSLDITGSINIDVDTWITQIEDNL